MQKTISCVLVALAVQVICNLSASFVDAQEVDGRHKVAAVKAAVPSANANARVRVVSTQNAHAAPRIRTAVLKPNRARAVRFGGSANTATSVGQTTFATATVNTATTIINSTPTTSTTTTTTAPPISCTAAAGTNSRPPTCPCTAVAAATVGGDCLPGVACNVASPGATTFICGGVGAACAPITVAPNTYMGGPNACGSVFNKNLICAAGATAAQLCISCTPAAATGRPVGCPCTTNTQCGTPTGVTCNGGICGGTGATCIPSDTTVPTNCVSSGCASGACVASCPLTNAPLGCTCGTTATTPTCATGLTCTAGFCGGKGTVCVTGPPSNGPTVCASGVCTANACT